MPECDSCGSPLEDPRDKNASGWWRDMCLPCISESVDPEPVGDIAAAARAAGWDIPER